MTNFQCHLAGVLASFASAEAETTSLLPDYLAGQAGAPVQRTQDRFSKTALQTSSVLPAVTRSVLQTF
jgi:hypothetical protein